MPHTYQLQIKSITPNSNTTKKVVTLNGQSLLNENDTYTFTIPDEWVFDLTIVVSDVGRNEWKKKLGILTLQPKNLI